MTYKEEPIRVPAIVTQVLDGPLFHVELPNGYAIPAHIAGRVRKTFGTLAVGDRVEVEMSAYDLSRARIIGRVG